MTSSATASSCFFLAAIPYGIGFVIVAGPGASPGALFVYAILQILAYAIVAAGLVGLLYKTVVDGVGTARTAGDESVRRS